MTSFHQLCEVIPGLSEFQGNYLKILVQFEKGMPSFCLHSHRSIVCKWVDVLVCWSNSFCTALKVTRKFNFRNTIEVCLAIPVSITKIIFALPLPVKKPPFTKTKLGPRVSLQNVKQQLIGLLMIVRPHALD